MNERPIIFNGEMVRAILDGRKTQTRRVVKPQPECDIPGAYFDAYNGGPQWNWWTEDNRLCNAHTIVECPYGQPGDRLWVRETFCRNYRSGRLIYRATEKMYNLPINSKWTPSIYMPRWASRITLEIKDVRVEKVRKISEKDAKEEGVVPSIVGDDLDHLKYRAAFQTLWNSINEKRGYGWDVNSWVWVIEFERMK